MLKLVLLWLAVIGYKVAGGVGTRTEAFAFVSLAAFAFACVVNSREETRVSPADSHRIPTAIVHVVRWHGRRSAAVMSCK